MIPERVIYNKEEEGVADPKELTGTKFVIDEPYGRTVYVVTDIHKGDSMLCCSATGTTRVISAKKINKNSSLCSQNEAIFGDVPSVLLDEASKYMSKEQTLDELLIHTARLNLTLNRLSRSQGKSEGAQLEFAYALAEVQLLLSRVQKFEFVQNYYDEAKENAIKRLSDRVDEKRNSK